MEQLTEVGRPAEPLPARHHGRRVADDHDHAAAQPVGQPLGGEQRIGVVQQGPAPEQAPGQEAGRVVGHPGQVVGRAVLPELGADVVPQLQHLAERGQPAVLVLLADVPVVPLDLGVEHARRAPRRVVGVERLVDVGDLAARLQELADPAGAGARHPGDDDRRPGGAGGRRHGCW
ncbi:MAG TPA: hypothetical protein VJB61_02400 [Actinomycetota bacterium]